AIHVQWRGRNILVDTPPELRLQLIRSHVRHIDAILYTHSHADHVFGLDDVRRYNDLQGGELPIFARPDVLEVIERAYRYIFIETQGGGGKPQVRLVPIAEPRGLEHHGLRVDTIPVFPGRPATRGFRLRAFAPVP